MQVFEKSGTLIIKAPAKLNLFLEVLGRRHDGYHEIETVMQTISLYDELTLAPAESEIRLVTDSPDVPHDSANLVVRAGELLRKHTGCRQGATIHLKKNIPVGAGMGGGSSDAAAALVGLNRLWKLSLSREILHNLAAKLGSDIPFFLYGGTALCRGRGERVARLIGVRPLTYVVVCPALHVSTREVYEGLPRDMKRGFLDTRLFLDDIIEGEGSVHFPRLFNRLESVTTERYELLRRLGPRMTESGLESVTMTGSGSAFFGIAGNRKEAGTSVDYLTGMGLGRVFIAQSIS